jgi:exodeoxyribonuclease V gamma subunit
LTGSLSNLRQDSEQQYGVIHLTAQELIKDKKIKYHKLLVYWVQHLAGCAMSLNLKTLVIGFNAVIELDPIAQPDAHEQLRMLVEAWHQGMQAPLPVACKTSFAFLSAPPDKAMDAAESQYEGDDWNDGEVDYDAYLARFFPSFASLKPEAEQDGFLDWTNKLYLSAFNQIKQQPAQGAQL